MRRTVVLLSLVIEALAVAACAADGPDDTDEPQPKLRETDSSKGKRNDDDFVSTKSPSEPTRSETPSTPTPTPTPAPTPSTPPTTPPAPPAKPVCALGNGLYCGGNGVPGNPNELYRCIDGVPQLEKVCAFDCARMPDGKNDVCACALGNGLYCGGNGVNGDPDKLYRCTGGVVTLEKVCGGGCEKRPNGYNDRCF